MTGPCDRKRCKGTMTVQATEIRRDGTVWEWLACDRDTRHITERDTSPAAAAGQDTLPGMEDR